MLWHRRIARRLHINYAITVICITKKLKYLKNEARESLGFSSPLTIFGDFFVLYLLKPAAHESKQLSKWPGKAVCSAVSSRVRRSFRENFATQGREENICHVWYFWPRKADSSPCAVNVWIGLSQINQLANEIGLLAHVISKLKMAEFFKFRTFQSSMLAIKYNHVVT